MGHEGLETNNFIRWTNELDTFLSERQPNKQGNIKSANDIIHTLFYVVNGAGTRVEETEIDILKNIYQKYSLSASVIITNCDIAKEHELTAIESILKRHGLSSFRVCSISKKTRGGDKIEPFGKDPAIRQILSASYEKVGKELTLSILKQIIVFINETRNKAKALIEASDISLFNLDAIDDIDWDDVLNNDFDYDNFIPDEYKNYYNFLENFNVSYQGHDIMSETFNRINDVIDKLDITDINIGRKMTEAENNLENGDLFEQIGAFFQVAKIALRLKKALKDAIDEVFDLAVRELQQQIRKVKSASDCSGAI